MAATRHHQMLRLALAATAVVFLALPVIHGGVRPNEYEGGRSRDAAAAKERNSSAVSRMFGELRTSMSDIMFIKTERYLHTGVAYGVHGGHQPGQVAGDHAGAASTLIRPPGEDFRGFVGTLEREVKPWIDPSKPHAHSDGTELLPWYRLMTLTDPYYVRGYLIGTWWLKNHQPQEALWFVEEGIRNNPDAFQLHFMRGQVLRQFAGDAEDEGTEAGAARARDLERQALESYRRGMELVLRQRPAGEEVTTLSWWNDYVEEDARAVCRMAVFLEDRIGDPDRATRDARRVLAVITNEGPLRRYAERPLPED
jgi:hypothetical protein